MVSNSPHTAPKDGLITALSMLTVFPSGRALPSDDAGRRAVKWLPTVGGLVGAVVATLAALAQTGLRLLGVEDVMASVAAAIVAVMADFAITRGMHWDGLADVADAWWGGFDRVRRLEIMSDSAVGSFGVFAVVTASAALLFGFTLSAGAFAALIPAFAVSRFAAVFAAQLGTPAKAGGLGGSVLAHGTPYARGYRAVVTWLVALLSTVVAIAIVSLWLGDVYLVALATATGVSVLVAAALPHLIAGRMGGVTGDVIGASILITEVLSVLAFAVATVTS